MSGSEMSPTVCPTAVSTTLLAPLPPSWLAVLRAPRHRWHEISITIPLIQQRGVMDLLYLLCVEGRVKNARAAAALTESDLVSKPSLPKRAIQKESDGSLPGTGPNAPRR